MKKILSLVLALAMVLSMGLIGTAHADDSDVTLRIFLLDKPTPDDQMVTDELTKYVFDKLGFNIELVKTDGYGSQLPLLLASDEQMDACFDAGWMDYYNRVRTGAYAELSELLKLTPKLVETIPDVFWEGAKVDGGIYGVTTYKETATTWGVFCEKEFMDSVSFDYNSVDELSDVEPLLAALKESGDRPGFQLTNSASPTQLVKVDMYHNFDMVAGDSSFMSVVRRTEPETVLNYYATEEYKAFVTMMHDWYNKGYIAEDVLTRTDYKEYTNAQKMGLAWFESAPLSDYAQTATYGKEIVVMSTSPALSETASATGSMFCIPAKSKYQEQTIKFLELWNTDPYVKNTICYGLEGVHYTVNDDGRITRAADAGEKFSGQNWTTGNSMISYVLDSEPIDKWEQYKEFGEKAISAVTLGFAPDTTSILDQIAMCQAAVVEYGNLLSLGTLDPEQYLPIFLDALNASGAEQITAEFQKQYDAWRAAK